LVYNRGLHGLGGTRARLSPEINLNGLGRARRLTGLAGLLVKLYQKFAYKIINYEKVMHAIKVYNFCQCLDYFFPVT